MLKTVSGQREILIHILSKLTVHKFLYVHIDILKKIRKVESSNCIYYI